MIENKNKKQTNVLPLLLSKHKNKLQRLKQIKLQPIRKLG
jgi:hypothetical protein